MPDISFYSAVLLSTVIRIGRPNSQAPAFVDKHQGALSRMPVAYFIVCLTMQADSEENRCTAGEFIQALRDKAPEVQPVALGLLGGVLDYDQLILPLKLVLKLAKVQEGDYRNPDAIREWVEELRPALRTTDGYGPTLLRSFQKPSSLLQLRHGKSRPQVAVSRTGTPARKQSRG